MTPVPARHTVLLTQSPCRTYRRAAHAEPPVLPAARTVARPLTGTAHPPLPVPCAGRGRGLGLSGEQPGQPGDLLLVSVPISVVYGEGPEAPAGVTGVRAGVGSDSSELEEDEDDLGEGEAGYEARLETLADLMEEQRCVKTTTTHTDTLPTPPRPCPRTHGHKHTSAWTDWSAEREQ